MVLIFASLTKWQTSMMHHRAVYLVTIRKGLPMRPRWLSLLFLVRWVTFSLHRGSCRLLKSVGSWTLRSLFPGREVKDRLIWAWKRCGIMTFKKNNLKGLQDKLGDVRFLHEDKQNKVRQMLMLGVEIRLVYASMHWSAVTRHTFLNWGRCFRTNVGLNLALKKKMFGRSLEFCHWKSVRTLASTCLLLLSFLFLSLSFLSLSLSLSLL